MGTVFLFLPAPARGLAPVRVGWSVGRLVGWSVGRLVGRLGGWLVGWAAVSPASPVTWYQGCVLTGRMHSKTGLTRILAAYWL